MSAQEIERFNSAVKANTAMQSEVASIGNNLPELVDYANRNGFQFSKSDIDAISKNADLSDSDLDKIAGGGGAVGVAALMVVEIVGVVAVVSG